MHQFSRQGRRLVGHLPPGHCHCAGRHQFSGRHHRQVADVHQQIQARHQGDGDDNRPGQVHLEAEKEAATLEKNYT